MQWIHEFDLFLFDFDGLLVDTEQLHYQAYIEMMKEQGLQLNWNFLKYASVAHLTANALKEALYAEFPTLNPDWQTLYARKKHHYLELLHAGKIGLMPGAEELLAALAKHNIRRCVVTNSFLEQTKLISSHIPALQTIPHWITRENYERQKPDPQPYQKAIEKLGLPGDRIIGFEDTLRGIQALQGTPATPILVTTLLERAPTGVHHFSSLPEICF